MRAQRPISVGKHTELKLNGTEREAGRIDQQSYGSARQAHSAWDSLPEGVCHSLARSVKEDSDRASARLVCKQWAGAVAASCTGLTVTGQGPSDWVMTFCGIEELDWRAPPLDLSLLQDLANLRSLQLQGSKPVDLTCLSQLKGLTALDLSSYSRRYSCIGSCRELAFLPCLHSLKDLRLRNCSHLNDDGLHLLVHLQGLTALNLRGCCHVSSTGLYQLSSISTLESLDLTDCAVTGPVVQHLSRLRQIRLLRIGRCDVTDEMMTSLGHMSSLTCLDLTGCDGITNHGVSKLRGLHWLATIIMFAATVKNPGVVELKHLPALTSLDISYCAKISGPGLAEIRRMTWLRELNVSGSGISNTTLTSEIKHLVRLTSLNLSSCNISDEGLKDLVCLTGLTWLGLNLCSIVTAAGVVRLVAQLSKLQYLSMCGCRRIPSKMMPSLKKRLPINLSTIY